VTVWRRNQWTIAGGLGGLLFALLGWLNSDPGLAVGFFIAGFASAVVPAIVDAEQRRHGDLAREAARAGAEAAAYEEAEADQLAACRTLAAAAREILLETALWVDIDAHIGQMQKEWANPGIITFPGPESWSVDAIVERGVEGLRDRVPWNSLEYALETHASQLSGFAGTYSGRLSSDALRSLEAVIDAAGKAGAAARDGWRVDASATEIPPVFFAREEPPITPEERREQQSRIEDARVGFVLALQNLQGSVERLERHAQPLCVEEQPGRS